MGQSCLPASPGRELPGRREPLAAVGGASRVPPEHACRALAGCLRPNKAFSLSTRSPVHTLGAPWPEWVGPGVGKPLGDPGHCRLRPCGTAPLAREHTAGHLCCGGHEATTPRPGLPLEGLGQAGRAGAAESGFPTQPQRGSPVAVSTPPSPGSRLPAPPRARLPSPQPVSLRF